MRSKLIGVTKDITVGYASLILLLTPYLYYVFVPGLPSPPNPTTIYSNDLLTFALPLPVLFIAASGAGSALGHFIASTPWWEQAGYLGPELLILTLLFAQSYWRLQSGKFLILNLIVIAVMSLGPVLHIAGKRLAPMPWRLFNTLPLIRDALPGRFGMYLFLIAAVAAAIYLAEASVPAWRKVAFAGFSVLFIMPRLAVWHGINVSAPLVGTPGQSSVYLPDFFASGQYKRYLSPGDKRSVAAARP
jgi:hypothetical protein